MCYGLISIYNLLELWIPYSDPINKRVRNSISILIFELIIHVKTVLMKKKTIGIVEKYSMKQNKDKSKIFLLYIVLFRNKLTLVLLTYFFINAHFHTYRTTQK